MTLREGMNALLERSERIFRTDVKYVASGGFWLTLGQVFTSGSSLLLAFAFANLVPPETYGTYRYVLSITGILTIATLGGMNTALVRSVANGLSGSLLPSFYARVRWGLLGAVAAFGFAGYYYFWHHDTTLALAFCIVAVATPLMDSFTLYSAYLQGRQDFKRSTKYFIVSQVVATITLLSSLLITDNVLLILSAYFAPWVLMRGIFFMKMARETRGSPAEDDTIKYGKHLSAISIIGTVSGQIDKVLVFHYLGTVDLAVYAFALSLPDQIRGYLKGLTSLILPRFAVRDEAEIRRDLASKYVLLGIAMASITVAYIVCAPFIFQILFPKYLASVLYTQLYAVSLLAFAFQPASILLSAKRKLNEQYILNTVLPFIQIILLWVALALWGLIGMMIVRVAAQFAGYLTAAALLHRRPAS